MGAGRTPWFAGHGSAENVEAGQQGPTEEETVSAALLAIPRRDAPAERCYGAVVSQTFDRAEIGDLFRRHGAMVYRRTLRLLGNPADAQEATQEVFLRVLRAGRGFEGRSTVSSWLYRIATNYCLNQIRDRSRRRELFDQHVAPVAPRQAASASPVTLGTLRRLLAEADPLQAQAIVYVYLDGLSYSEAAPLLGVSKRTVGNLVERFRTWAKPKVVTPLPRGMGSAHGPPGGLGPAPNAGTGGAP